MAALAVQVAETFRRIHREQMAGLPLLNESLEVETVGFREIEERVGGVIVTPWMMGWLLFPGADDHWETLELGSKQVFTFPGGTYRFLQNVIGDLGPVMMYSVHSPMRLFPNQSSAIAEATGFLDRAMSPAEQANAEDPVNEELLGRILRGEQVPEAEAVIAMQAEMESSGSA